MKRPMCVIGLTLALTTWVAFFFSGGQTLLLSAAATTTGLLLAVAQKTKPRLRMACTVCFAAAVSLALHTLYDAQHIAPFQRAAGETVTAEGLITDAGKGTKAVYYTVAAKFPGRPDLPDANLDLHTYGDMEYVQGDVIRCEVKLSDAVYGLADYNFTKGIVVSATAADEFHRLERGYALRRWVYRLRERLRQNAYLHLPEDSADIVAAMVLGLQDNVGPEVYSSINRAGTAHLLSVSGLHLSVLTAFVLGALERLRVPRRAGAVAAIAAAFAFTVLVGLSASIVRSFLMTALSLLGRAGPRRGDSLSALGFAVAVICVCQPAWVLGRGFWFSAASTLGILLFGGRFSDRLYRRFKRENRLYNRCVREMLGAFAISMAAYAFTLPLSILFSGWVSLISPVANVLITPFVPVVIGGGILCSLVGGGGPAMALVAWVTDACNRLILGISALMARLPFATAPVDEGWMLIWMAFVAAVVVLLLVFRADKRLVAYGAALAVFAFGLGGLSCATADHGVIELATIAECDAAVLLRDGDAVILGTPDKTEINRLLRYLEFRGVSRIRAVVAADCGEQVGSGLLRLRGRYPVDCVVGPNDDYILAQLATVLEGCPVYSGGYATLDVLGGAKISLSLPDGDILVRVGDNSILKSAEKYGIIKGNDDYAIGLYPAGDLVLDGATGLAPSPVGRSLYGETRFRLRV